MAAELDDETVLENLRRHARAKNRGSDADGEEEGDAVARDFATRVGFALFGGGGDKKKKGSGSGSGSGGPDAATSAIGTLSGGWKMRLSLARAMMAEAELLLLDEPTNHLDAEAVAWLTAYLQTTEGLSPPMTVVVVSHDATFLEAVVTDVLLLAHAKRQLEAYRGSYAHFRSVKPEVAAYLQMSTTLSGASVLRAGEKFSLSFPRPDRLDGVGSVTKAVIRVDKVTFGYEGTAAAAHRREQQREGGEGEGEGPAGEGELGDLRIILRNVQCRVAMGSKVAVLGGNGAGKSTLVRLIVGDLSPLTGDVWKHPSLRIAYVAQHSLGHVEQHLDKSPCEYLQWRFAGAVDREALAMSTMAEDAEVKEACVRSFIRSFIHSFIHSFIRSVAPSC